MHLKIPEYRLKFTQRSKWYGNPHELEMIHLGNADYVIKSKDHQMNCPLCNKVNISIRIDKCPDCGATMSEMCLKMFADYDVYDNRYQMHGLLRSSLTLEQDRELTEKRTRWFLLESIPWSVRVYLGNRFKDSDINEANVETLFLVYQKSIGIEEQGKELTQESKARRKGLFKKLLEKSVESNADALNLLWRLYKRYLDCRYKRRNYKKELFSVEIEIDANHSKKVDYEYFESFFNYLNNQSEILFNQSYQNETVTDVLKFKRYLVYMALMDSYVNSDYIKQCVYFNLFGYLDLVKNCIYRTVSISINDVVEETESLYNHQNDTHKCERVYLKIPILLQNGETIIKTISGTYCAICRKYFILDTEFKKILVEGKIKAQLSFSHSSTSLSPFGELSPESLLRKCGYTVNASDGYTKEQRQKLLKAIIQNKLYTPSGIVSHFRFLISMNNNVTTRDMSSAIQKWQEDIDFLCENYS